MLADRRRIVDGPDKIRAAKEGLEGEAVTRACTRRPLRTRADDEDAARGEGDACREGHRESEGAGFRSKHLYRQVSSVAVIELEATAMSANAPPRSSLAAESLLFASHLLNRWRRQPGALIQGLVLPTFLLIAYKLLVGKSIVRITGTDSLYGLVPMCAVAGAMFGALAAGRGIAFERDSGLIGRLWVFPVHRASALTGRLLAEAARTLASSALITAVGVGLGLRFERGWLTVIPFILVPVLVVIPFSMAVTAIAVRSKSGAVLVWLGVPSTGSVFSSSGVVRIQRLPSWCRAQPAGRVADGNWLEGKRPIGVECWGCGDSPNELPRYVSRWRARGRPVRR